MTRLNKQQIDQVCELAQRAAKRAMDFYHGDLEISIKNDDSPVTQADMAVSALLESALPEIANFPVLSEENQPDLALWMQWQTYWLIDPIDGTKHFINRTGDFCICIALIYQHQAVFGLIVSPTSQELWFGQLADVQQPAVLQKSIAGEICELRNVKPAVVTVTLSANFLSTRMAQLLSILPDYRYYSRGSALKYIDVVEGRAQLYPKLWDTCEWDSAAGQCIVECAGGGVIRFDTGKSLRYGQRESLINPYFLAYRGLPDDQVNDLRLMAMNVPEYVPESHT